MFFVVLVFALTYIDDVSAMTGEPPPGLAIQVIPEMQVVSEKCPVTYTVRLVSLNGFYGKVNLTVVELPRGVTAFVYPNPIEIQKYNSKSTHIRVEVSPDASQGNQTINIVITPLPGSFYNHDAGLNIYGVNFISLYVGTCESQSTMNINLTRTTTSTQTNISTITLSTTITNTITIETDNVTDTPIYIWAIGATIIAIILPLILTLRKRR